MEIRNAVLAIDQGTTSTRAILFDSQSREITSAQQEFRQHYPQDGWVEHSPEDLWQTTLKVVQRVLAGIGARHIKVVAIGITNQRETTLVWDRETGEPIYNAIVWQDRRTAAECEHIRSEVAEVEIQSRSGLLVDPYFSATKIAWILDHVEGARARAEQGDLLFGTVDSWLIWKLTGGAVHATDATNASRTNLYNIHSGEWDDELLRIFRVPRAMLPDVRDSAADFGTTLPGLTGKLSIPILAVAGDQQAAAIGQCCFDKGQVKATYGTGCFVLMNTGTEAIQSTQRLLTTVAWQLDGKRSYALEGSIFIAGAAVQWLRDELGIIRSAAETESLARKLSSNKGVYLVPAFTGLGVPYWRADARGALVGLTRGAGKAEIARAALEAVCYQTSDLFAAMEAEGLRPTSLRVDGGMVANNWMLQFLANILDTEVLRPAILETTALGVAYLAGRQAGIYGDFSQFDNLWQCTAEFHPDMQATQRQQLLGEWARAVQRVTL
jgi:glycerol kinase